jgi:hypothetical protein
VLAHAAAPAHALTRSAAGALRGAQSALQRDTLRHSR